MFMLPVVAERVSYSKTEKPVEVEIGRGHEKGFIVIVRVDEETGEVVLVNVYKNQEDFINRLYKLVKRAWKRKEEAETEDAEKGDAEKQGLRKGENELELGLTSTVITGKLFKENLESKLSSL